MARKVRGGEETCEALDEASAVDATRRVLAQASQVWSRWACRASGDCCQLRVTGRSPWLWPSEWWLLRRALEVQRRAPPPPRADGGCRFLDPLGRCCTVYDARPFGCRTYFCERGRGPVLKGLSTHELLDELAQLNIAVDSGSAPRPIEAWCADPPEGPLVEGV